MAIDANAMNALDNLFTQAKNVVEEKTEFENLPDGKYVGTVTEIKIKETKNGKPLVSVTIKNNDNGRMSWLSLFLTSNKNTEEENAKAMARARGTLEKLGASTEVASFGELVKSAQENAVGTVLEYHLETYNGYQNINQFKLKVLQKAQETQADPFGDGEEIDISDDLPW